MSTNGKQKQLLHRKTAEKCWHKFHLDAHIPPDEPMLSDNWSANEFVRKVVATGADSFCVFAKCHYGYSYYNTKIGHKHPMLKINLMGELVREFKKQAPELPLFIYYNLRFSPVDAKLHPEWVIQGDIQHKEKDHVSTMWLNMCFNSGYRAVVFGQMEEITKQYPIDGFFLDFSRAVGPCHCQECKKKYKAETGKAVPQSAEEPAYKAYCEWQRQDSDKFVIELSEYLQGIKPHISLCSNHCYGIQQPLEVPEQYGYISEDVVEKDQMRGCLESLASRYYCSLDVPAEIMTTRMVHWWTDWGFKSDDELMLQNAVILAHGLRIDLADELYPNYEIPERVLSLFTKVIARAKEIRPIMADSMSQPDVLILHSASTYYADYRASNDDADKQKTIHGMHNIFIQSMQHHQFVNEHYLDKWLKISAILVLPEQTVIDEKTQEKIKVYVKSGGILIGTGSTLLNSGLHDVFGVEIAGEYNTPHQFLMAKPFVSYEGLDFPIMVRGRSFCLKTKTAKVVSLLQEGMFSKEGIFHGHPIGERKNPGVTENQYGKGKAIAVAVSVGGSMQTHLDSELRRFMLGLVRSNNPNPFMLSKSSDTVEFTHFRKKNQTIVNLIHHPAKTYDMCRYVIDKIEPIRDFKLTLKLDNKPNRVFIEQQDNMPEWSYQDGILSVSISNLHIHTILVIE